MMRLETIAPEVVLLLKRARLDQARRAAWAACDVALQTVPLGDDIARIRSVCDRESLSSQQQLELREFIARSDQEYFELHEASESGRAAKQDFLRKFAEARAASALLFAAQADGAEMAGEAIYEAAAAVEDKQDLFTKIEAILDG